VLLATLVVGLLPAGPAGGATGPPKIRLVTPAQVSEGAPIFFTVRLSRPANRLVTVEYATKNGTATWPDDYRRRTGKVHFKPGQTRRRVTVPTTEDGSFEALERFSMEIKRPAAASASATIAKPTATAKIGDDDPRPALSISDAQASEGTGSAGQLVFNVQLSKAAGTRVTVQFATANGSAQAGIDYTASTGSVSFLAGETAKQIPVTLTPDSFDEPNETLTVSLSSPFGATIADGQAQGTITDDEVDCVPADSPPGTNLGSLSGDTGSPAPTIQRNDAISPCGDTDWFQVSVTEDNGSTKDLQATVVLQPGPPNGSPASGNINLCVYANSTATTPICRNQAAGQTEVVCAIGADSMFVDDDFTLLIEVKGQSQAANGYTLNVSGNVNVTPPCVAG
jgi:Calx-beta domain